MVLVLVVYDRCRPLGGGVGCSLEWPTQGCAAGPGMFFLPPPPPPPRPRDWPTQGGAAGQGMFYLPPPPCPPRGADMLDMTTDAQEGNNKTLQGLINTMQSHSVVMRFEITVIFY